MFAKIRFFGYNILGFSKVGEYSLTFIIKGVIMKIELGRVLRPQGIKGEIKVEPLSNPEFFKAIELVEINGKEANIESASVRDGAVFLKLDIIGDRNAAENYRDAIITAEKEALPDLADGQFYYDDLIGCRVFFETGEFVGEIVDIQNYGNADLFEIHKDYGSILCPYVDGVFVSIDIKAKKIIANEKRYKEVTDYED